MRGLFVTLSVCGALLIETSVSAQTGDAVPQTRAEALKLARDQKQKTLEPYKRNGLERGIEVAEQRLTPILAAPDGLHLKLGSLATGSGFAYGAGFRNRRLLDREGAFSVWAASSLKRYWAVEARFDMPDLAGGRVMLGTFGRRQNYPQEDFFGIGPGARRIDHSNFEYKDTIFGGRIAVKPASRLTVGSRVEYSRAEIGRGRNSSLPSIDDIFDDISVPGLGGGRTLIRTGAFADFDYRQPKQARRGGWYRFEASHFEDPSDTVTFTRYDTDLRQFFSILAERRVLALRLSVATTEPAPGSRVPFYMMPTLGGHDTLRGFRDYRFRGPHALLTQTEYRFEIWSGLDAALFYDAGKVTLQRKNLNFKNLEDAYGFGFRFNTDNGTILRIDAGFGSNDGKHLYIVFGDVF